MTPPRVTPERWSRLVRICRSLDAQFQYGAAPISSPGRLQRTHVLHSVGNENGVLPASLRTTGELDGSPKEAPAMRHDTPTLALCQDRGY